MKYKVIKAIAFLIVGFLITFINYSSFANNVQKVKLQLVASDLNAPIFLKNAPGDISRLFIGDQLGLIKILLSDGTFLKTPFLDIRDKLTPLLKAFDERGLLGLAFHPKFQNNGLLYINYSAKRRVNSPYKGKTAYTWRTSEFKVLKGKPNIVDVKTERVLIELDLVNRKNKGGGLAFGKDVNI